MIKFIYIETYGCSANQNNSEIIRGLIRQAGLDLVENPELADILILNTCIVKGPTENKMKGRIIELSKLGKPLIIAGCMPEIRKLKGENIFVLGINNITKVNNLIKKITENNYKEKDFISANREIKLNCSKISQNRLIGITQISEGCRGNCNYCITKLVKKDLSSYPPDQIIQSIKKDLEQGCKEIWLTSQDNACYGLDIDTNLINLLKKILNLKGKFKIRIGMMNPEHITSILDELIEIYRDDRMYKFLHIPIQSGSDRILKSMGRKYTIKQFLGISNRFKKEIPDITLATDLIAAYPGESEQDHQKNLELIQKLNPPVLNLTRFWPRPGTRAAKEKQVESKVARSRTLEIQKLHLSLALEENKKLENKEMEVFVNEKSGTTYFSRTDNYKIVIIKSSEKLLGKKLKVKIKKAFSHYLLGEIQGNFL
jgi:threonylcarbamoyladenosine tRNA methylthiotransferase CDKAL1